MAKSVVYRFSIFFCMKDDITKEYYFGDFEITTFSDCNAISRVSLICSGLMLANVDHIYYYKLIN